VTILHEAFAGGDCCPHCQAGTLYEQKRWSTVVRLKGQPFITGVCYQRQRLRCGLCGKTETAALPEEAGPTKYDASVASTLAVLRYGQGLPFNRIEKMQRLAGIPLPASQQWELVRDAADRGLWTVYRQLLFLAAQGNLAHNDDTRMRILALMAKLKAGEPLREDDPQRRGVFTTSILSYAEDRPTIALFFTGAKHAGENLGALLQQRLDGLPPLLQMCDGLSHNMPRELATIVANCLAHGRRNFCDVAEAFPDEVRHVLERLKEVYRVDAQAKEAGLSPDERLRLHQRESGPVMDDLHIWLKAQLDERRVEPNSSLGQAISYMLKRWDRLTLFLREPGAPLDNNVCERALKMSIRHRKNSLFYKTQRGADVGDLYMSLIYTCELSQVDPTPYLTALQRHAERVIERPQDWLPWNYHEQIPVG
jgi:transposase